MSDFKLIQFKVPPRLYEEFWRAFPEYGERSRVLKKLMALAIHMASKKDAFYQLIRQEANLEAEEDL